MRQISLSEPRSGRTLKGMRMALYPMLLLFTAVTGCGGSGSPDSTSPADDGDSDPTCANCDPVVADPGGETSEFGGDLASCPEMASTALDLDAEDLVVYRELVEGTHELSLEWTPEFLVDGMDGFEASTRVTFGVAVVDAMDVEFSAGDNPNYETAGCNDLRARALKLEIAIDTEDDSLDGTVQQWVEVLYPDSKPGPTLADGLHSASFSASSPGYPLEDFSSTLNFGADHEALMNGASVTLGFDFREDSLRGVVRPWLARRWVPLSGRFPDDGCNVGERSVDLDEVPSPFDATPRELFQSFKDEITAAAVPAAWQESSELAPAGTGGSGGEVRGELSETEVSFAVSEPGRACVIGEHLSIEAALTLRTEDGRLDYAMPLRVELDVSGGSFFADSSPWIGTEAFAGVTGVQDADFGSAEYASMHVTGGIEAGDGQLDGSLTFDVWEDFESRYFDEYPTLRWCNGPECDSFWCAYTSPDPDNECATGD